MFLIKGLTIFKFIKKSNDALLLEMLNLKYAKKKVEEERKEGS